MIDSITDNQSIKLFFKYDTKYDYKRRTYMSKHVIGILKDISFKTATPNGTIHSKKVDECKEGRGGRIINQPLEAEFYFNIELFKEVSFTLTNNFGNDSIEEFHYKKGDVINVPARKHFVEKKWIKKVDKKNLNQIYKELKVLYGKTFLVTELNNEWEILPITPESLDKIDNEYISTLVPKN